MITEIYVCGRAPVSAYVIVEAGKEVFRSSRAWDGDITFGGVTVPPGDAACELIAMIGGVIRCRSNGRMVVNLYTDGDDYRTRFGIGGNEHPFVAVLRSYFAAMDVFVGAWPSRFWDSRRRAYTANVFAESVSALVNKSL